MKIKKTKVILVTLLYIILIFNSSFIMRFNIRAEKTETDNPQILAQAAVLIDADTGVILFENNKDEKKFPASTTKIMTALLTLEKCKDLNQKIKMSHEAVYGLEPGSSHIAMNEGETLTIEQALYALLVSSANEVANALAEHISNNKTDFCKLMNKHAKELGCKNTNFINPHGFHYENHYTTAYDLALIMRQAIKYQKFKEIISTQRYEIPPTEKQSQVRVLYNTNKMIQNGSFFNKDVVGGKTGFTNEAGHTLVIYAKKNNINLISVVMGEEKTNAYTDTTKLLNYGFSKFHKIDILKKTDLQKSCSVYQKYKNKTLKIDSVNVYLENNISLTLPDLIKPKDLVVLSKYNKNLFVPVDKNKLVGEIIVKYKNQIINKTNLIPKENIKTLSDKEISKIYNRELIHKIFFMAIKIISYLALAIAIMIIIIFSLRNFNHKNKIRKRNKYKNKIVFKNINKKTK